ncbi:hypothetical protein ACLGL1_08870 [Peptococcus simiae]|uniref:hypothetical protein n=1 Tax=Peptococcus simiae TaxID=1643805 RepID=UPI00397EF116
MKKVMAITLTILFIVTAGGCQELDKLQAQYERNRAQSHREDVLREQQNDREDLQTEGEGQEGVKHPWQVGPEETSQVEAPTAEG